MHRWLAEISELVPELYVKVYKFPILGRPLYISRSSYNLFPTRLRIQSHKLILSRCLVEESVPSLSCCPLRNGGIVKGGRLS